MSCFIPAWCRCFVWENFLSPSERLGLLWYMGPFLRPLRLPFCMRFRRELVNFVLIPITSVGKLLMPSDPVRSLLPPPPLTDVFFIGWTRAVLSVSPILLLFREPDAHSVLVSYSIGDLWAPQFGSSPSWLCPNFMCVHNFPIGSEVCDFPLCFMSDPKIVLPLPGFIHCAQIL